MGGGWGGAFPFLLPSSTKKNPRRKPTEASKQKAASKPKRRRDEDGRKVKPRPENTNDDREPSQPTQAKTRNTGTATTDRTRRSTRSPPPTPSRPKTPKQPSRRRPRRTANNDRPDATAPRKAEDNPNRTATPRGKATDEVPAPPSKGRRGPNRNTSTSHRKHPQHRTERTRARTSTGNRCTARDTANARVLLHGEDRFALAFRRGFPRYNGRPVRGQIFKRYCLRSKRGEPHAFCGGGCPPIFLNAA